MKRRNAAARVGVALPCLIATLCGCNFAPHYERPKTDVGTQFKEAVHGTDPSTSGEEGWQLAAPRDAQLRGNWWELYGDPQLDELEQRIVISNQNVIAAEANYRESQALVREAQAQLFPTLSVNPSVTRSRSSASVETFGGVSGTTTTTGTGTAGTGTTGTGAAGTGTTGTGTGSTGTSGGSVGTVNSPSAHTIFSLPLEASYQVDLWGSIRNNVAENRFTAQASAAQLATALLSSQSNLAADYFQLRIADEERRILDETLADFRTNYHLVQTLFNNGLDSDEDLAQAETQLKSAEAQATDLGVTRATYEHAIAVLIGVPPSSFSLPYKRFRQTLPPIPVNGVPADLIERRPDIAAAERKVASTNAAIGVARAAYFPQLTLSGSAGFESLTLGTLLKWPNRFWSFGPELAQTIFDGGAHIAATAQARAQNDSAAATYRQTVLSALQSVEDDLASLRILAMEVQQEHDSAVAAQRAVKLSVIRFQQGVDSYINVITAQNSFLSARETEIQVKLRQLSASVNLINDLGGGWSTSQWQQTQQLAERPPTLDGKPQIPADDAGPPVVNPPPLPPREIKPEEIVQRDEDAVGSTPVAAAGK